MIGDFISKNGGQNMVITTLDDIAWALNLRGSDIEYNPVFKSYLVVSLKKENDNTITVIHLFACKGKFSDEKC